MEYLKDGLKHMRLKFYIEGSEPGLKGTVHSESKEVGTHLYVVYYRWYANKGCQKYSCSRGATWVLQIWYPLGDSPSQNRPLLLQLSLLEDTKTSSFKRDNSEGTDLISGGGQNGEECQYGEPHKKFQAVSMILAGKR